MDIASKALTLFFSLRVSLLAIALGIRDIIERWVLPRSMDKWLLEAFCSASAGQISESFVWRDVELIRDGWREYWKDRSTDGWCRSGP
jgi:hypothetical protein